MGITYYWGRPSVLLPDETCLHTQRWLWLISSKTGISYRVAFNTWPLWTFRFEITNYRLRVMSNIFLLTTQEISIWYPGRNPENDPEVMTGVSIQHGLLGRCLEVKSHNPTHTAWYWAPDLTLRFYFRDPEYVERIIVEAMNAVR